MYDTHTKNIASVNCGDLSVTGNQNAKSSYEKYDRKAPYGYKTHCLVCEGVLDFEAAKKHPKHRKSKLHTILPR